MKYFNFKFLIMLLALAMAIPQARADESLTVANGTSTNGVAPIYGNKFESTGRIQIIYPASMLEDLVDNDITSITFYQKPTSWNISGGVVEMYLRESEESSFQYITAYGMYDQDTFTKVATVNGITSILNSDNFTYTFTFDDPYHYEGGNLVIEMNIATKGSSNKTEWYGQSSSGVNVIATTYTISGSGNVTTMYPKATFTYEVGELPDYNAKVTPDAINFGKTAPNTSITQNVTVTNKGANPITPVVSGLTAPFSTTYSPTSIATGETATIPITFKPITTGNFDCQFQVGDASGNIDPVDITASGIAAYEKTIADGTATSAYIPLYGYYYDYKQINQMIYPEELLNDLKGKKINSMTFYGTNLNLQGGAYTFKLGITEQSSFTEDNLSRITEGLTTEVTVSDGTNTGNELTIVFDEPFNYEGGNLLIDFEETQKGSNYPQNNFYGINATGGSFNSYTSSGSVGANGTYSYPTVRDFLPKVTFVYTDEAVVATPELVVDPEELILDAEHNSFEVLGSNLKGDVTITVDNENFTVTPTTISKADAEQGATVTVTYTGTDVDGELATITVASQDAESATVSVMGAAPKPVLIADPEALDLDEATTFTVMGENLQGEVTLTVDNENFTVSPTTISVADAEEGATVTVAYVGTNTEGEEANITIKSAKAENVTVYVIGKAAAPVVVDAPIFAPEAGSYTEAQTVTITCPTEGAVVSYSTDGGETWTQGNTVTVNKDMTLMAKAEKGTTVTTASAVYSFEFPVEPITIEPITGYFKVKNNGNNKYVNIAGRKTMKFTNDIDTNAGTVIRVETDNHGQVQVLRSQAADLQGYANRAMKYVPEIVQIVANKLHAVGDGALLGDEGLNAIMEKFNESFDYHLYVEPADGGYRLYGKTPSMQPVVEFYREHTHQVDTKLPMLEGFINDAIQKLLEKTGGRGESILQPFSLHETWERMGGTLTEPVDSSSTMAFYHQVLMNKDYVWSFAYETAMTYWERVKAHPRYEELKDELGEFANYIDEIEQVRPNFKYYVVADADGPDFISEGNKDIKNNEPRTLWTLEARTDFKVNIPAEYVVNDQYVTTLYTDFAYTLPEGVTAYKVINVNSFGDAELEAIGSAVPAQTPVLLKATEAGMKTLTLNTADGAAIDGNLLKGPDYLIKTYQIKTPQVETLFNMAKNSLGEQFYNDYVAQYEHLMLKTAGTVNNKYFWGLPYDDVKNCIYINENDEGECVVRSLDIEDGIVAFYNNATVSTNKAFLVSEKHNTINLTLHGDINRNGAIEVGDVSALIDILLSLPERPYVEPDSTYPRGLDYVAADFNNDGEISIKDVSVLIDYLLNN